MSVLSDTGRVYRIVGVSSLYLSASFASLFILQRQSTVFFSSCISIVSHIPLERDIGSSSELAAVPRTATRLDPDRVNVPRAEP